MLQIIASITDDSRGIIDDPNMFIVQATVSVHRSAYSGFEGTG
jgi:hypothetical protein